MSAVNSKRGGTNRQHEIYNTKIHLESCSLNDLLGNFEDLQERIRKEQKIKYSRKTDAATNVISATKKDEVSRRNKARLETEKIFNIIKQEQAKAEEHYYKIADKWKTAENLKTSGQFQELLSTQVSECESLLRKKDSTIAELKVASEKKRHTTELTREKFEEETDIIQKRIEELVKCMHESGKKEIAVIRHSMDEIKHHLNICFSETLQEHEDEITHDKYDLDHEAIWGITHKTRRHLLETYEKLAEERKQLNKESHELEQLLHDTIASQFMNAEICNYGLKLLRIQMRESILISSDLKRTNIRAIDTVWKLRHKQRDANKNRDVLFQRMMDKYEKTQQRIIASIKTANFLHSKHKKRFDDVFNVKDQEARNILFSLLAMNRFISEKLLNRPWNKPDLSFLNKPQPPKLAGEKELLQRLNEFLQPDDGKSREMTSTKELQLKNSEEDVDDSIQTEEHFNRSLVLQKPLDIEKLLTFLCEQMEFILDNHTSELAKKVFSDIQTFIMSNSVFNVVGVRNTKDLQHLLAHIVNHSKTNSDGIVSIDLKSILMALADFLASQNKKTCEKKNIESDFSFNIKPSRGPKQLFEYWKNFSQVLPTYQEKLWDEVIIALKQKMQALETHVRLAKIKSALFQQNSELQKLFQQQKLGET